MTDEQEVIQLSFSETISTSIFATAEVSERLDELFTKTRKCLHHRFNEIKDYVCSTQGDVATLQVCNEIKIDDLQICLRKRIVAKVLTEAIILSLSKNEANYNIKESLLFVLTEERFKELGREEILNAFGDVILNLPEKGECDDIIKEGIVCRLKNNFK